MLSWIYWAVGIRDKERNSINHNSFGKMPDHKFINYARDIGENDDDDEPHKNIYEYKAFERSLKQKNQQQQYSKYYDYFNHS